MKAFGNSDIGLVREKNEDSLLVSAPLFAVADGMGGHAAGEIASQLALASFQEFLNRDQGNGSWPEKLTAAACAANEAVYEEARKRERLAGMGTTLSAVYLEGIHAYWLHIGDSRLYLYRAEQLQQITSDHSLVWELVRAGSISAEEARHHPRRNVLTKALGTQEKIEADVGMVELKAGDYLLLCSDGLSGLVDENQLQQLLAEHKDESLKTRVDLMISAANNAGGHDNISAILVEVGQVDAS